MGHLHVLVDVHLPLSSEYGTHEAVKARLWLSGTSPENILSCSLFARKWLQTCMIDDSPIDRARAWGSPIWWIFTPKLTNVFRQLCTQHVNLRIVCQSTRVRQREDPRSGQSGTYKKANERFWPWIMVKVLSLPHIRKSRQILALDLR